MPVKVFVRSTACRNDGVCLIERLADRVLICNYTRRIEKRKTHSYRRWKGFGRSCLVDDHLMPIGEYASRIDASCQVKFAFYTHMV